MIVTINTDASYHPQFKVGAFAFWIVCNQGKIMHSGPLKEAKSPMDAELKCIANALTVLLKSSFTGVHKIIINSDALYGFGKVKRKSESEPGKYCSRLLKMIRQKYGVTGKQMHEFRHVKAHSGTETKRQWVNDWCDKAAKRALHDIINSKMKQK